MFSPNYLGCISNPAEQEQMESQVQGWDSFCAKTLLKSTVDEYGPRVLREEEVSSFLQFRAGINAGNIFIIGFITEQQISLPSLKYRKNLNIQIVKGTFYFLKPRFSYMRVNQGCFGIHMAQ